MTSSAADALFTQFYRIEGLFCTSQTFSPWDDFGPATSVGPTDKTLEQFKQGWLKKLKDLPKESNQPFVDGIIAKVEAWTPHLTKRMPVSVEEPTRTGNDCFVEVEQQKEVDAAVDLNKETSGDEEYRDPIPVWKLSDPFNPKIDLASPQDVANSRTCSQNEFGRIFQRRFSSGIDFEKLRFASQRQGRTFGL